MEDEEECLNSECESTEVSEKFKGPGAVNGVVSEIRNCLSHESEAPMEMSMHGKSEEVANGVVSEIQNCPNHNTEEPKVVSTCSNSDRVANGVSEIQIRSHSEFGKPMEVISFIVNEGAANGAVSEIQNCPIHKSEETMVGCMCIQSDRLVNGSVFRIPNCTNDEYGEPMEVSMCFGSEEVANGVISDIQCGLNSESAELMEVSTCEEMVNGFASEVQNCLNEACEEPMDVSMCTAREGMVSGVTSQIRNCLDHKPDEPMEVPTCIKSDRAVKGDASKILSGFNHEPEEPKEVLACIKDEGTTKGVVRTCNDFTEGSSGESLRTYKRRKLSKKSSERKVIEEGKASTETIEEQLTFDVKRHPCGQAGFCTINALHDCSPAYWRTLVLESIYKSLRESEGGIRGCVHNALEYLQKNACTNADKGNIKEDVQCHSQTSLVANGSHVGAAEYLHAACSESRKMDHQNATEMFQRSFFSILVSEKFAALCKLLSESFQGVKVESFFDYNLIDRRMKEGAYERSPGLFTSDILQILGKFQRIGSELVSLARGLSNLSCDSNCEQISPWGRDYHSKRGQPESRAINEICYCVHCGKKADGRGCLVCDYCEELYHVSCIQPAVKGIPKRSWRCPKCFSSGIDLPHEHCVVCEKLNATGILPDTDPNVTSTNEEETFPELEESSNCVTGDGFDTLEESRHVRCCKICSIQIENHEKHQTCGHPFCPSKYYHAKCLTKKQLKSHASCWYCPSCLCRVCLKNRDDEKIVLCDACDHGYHIYCMKPSRDTVPRGKWFCRSCKSKIQQIRKAKQAYGILGQKLSMEKVEVDGPYKNPERNSQKKCQGQGKSEGVDMLLTAASTLNFEEKLVGSQSHLD